LEYVHPQRVYEVVDQGHADLGLVSYPEESASLAALPWKSETMVLVCYPQHPLAKQRSAKLEMLNDEPFVAFQAGLKIREEIDRALAMHKVRARMALEFDNIETIKRAIEIGAGVSLLPEPTMARELESGSLVKIPLEGVALERTLGIIHRRDRKLNETAEQFIQLLQSQNRPAAAAVTIAPVEVTESNGQSTLSRMTATAAG